MHVDVYAQICIYIYMFIYAYIKLYIYIKEIMNIYIYICVSGHSDGRRAEEAGGCGRLAGGGRRRARAQGSAQLSFRLQLQLLKLLGGYAYAL